MIRRKVNGLAEHRMTGNQRDEVAYVGGKH